MLLERIHVRGFRSYEEATLDLHGVPAAVVMGHTGSGKSALLVDAVLWALFGKTRSKAGEGYIRLGADECRVEVDFRVAGTLYSVTRLRSLKTKRGKSELHLGIKTDAGLTPLSGASIAETEAKVVALLGAEYDAVVASVVSPQGESDRFTAPPRISIDGKTYEGGSARIRILQQILGLDQYDGWRREAMGRTTKAQTDAETALAVVRAMEERAKDRPATEQQHADQVGLRTVLETTLARNADETTTAQASLLATREEIAQRSMELERVAEDEAESTTLQARVTEVAGKVARFEKILAHADEVRAKATEEAAIAKELEGARTALSQTETEIAGLAGQEAALVRTLTEARAQVQKEYVVLGAEIKTQAINAKQQAETSALRIRDLTKQAAVMDTVPCLSVEGLPEQCPLLQQARVAKASIPEWQRSRAKYLAWAADPAQTDRLKELEQLLAEQSDADVDGLRHRRLTLEASRTGLQHSVSALEQQRKALERWVAIVPEIDLAAREIEGLRVEQAATQEKLEAITARLAGVPTRRQALADAQRTAAEHAAALTNLRSARSSMARDQAGAQAAVGRLEAALEEIGRAEVKAEESRGMAAKTQEDGRGWALLEQAYKGIPILTLEAVAVPAIEAEANRILARVSPSGMRVELRTQRALKGKDAVVDALDIVVRDRVGERTYEDFSGGQKFLLDLSLRLALAKLQQRRTGSHLETLILDEGFGSLDSATLSQLRATLEVAREDYPRLIVVSHVGEMEHVFPVVVRVSGGPECSTVTVVQ